MFFLKRKKEEREDDVRFSQCDEITDKYKIGSTVYLCGQIVTIIRISNYKFGHIVPSIEVGYFDNTGYFRREEISSWSMEKILIPSDSKELEGEK
jgi:hypothetical protein